MFPAFARPPLLPSHTLRSRLVRGLDVAVEFATLGEFGVEEVELEPIAGGGEWAWDWPPRCTSRARRSASAPRGGARVLGGAACCSS